MKTKEHAMKKSHSLIEFCRKVLVVLVAIAMVSTSTPYAYAVEDTLSSSASEAEVVDDQAQDTDDQTQATDETQGTVEQDTGEVTPQEEGDGADTTEGDTERQEEQTPETEVVDPSITSTAEDVTIRLAFEHAYIHYKGQAIAAPMTTLTHPAGQALEFAAIADDGCILQSVKAIVDGEETVLEPQASGMYVVDAPFVKDGLTVSVEASRDPFESTTTSSPIEDKRNEQSEFVYEDSDVKVTATLTDPAALPADVQFRVTPVTKDTKDEKGNQLYDYDAYMQALNDNAQEGQEYNEQNTLLYDVAFLVQKTDADGKAIDGEWTEVQLDDGQVTLNLQFKKNQLEEGIDAKDSQDIEIHHLPLVDSVRSSIDSTAEAGSISANDVIVENPVAQSVNVEGEQMRLSLDSLCLISATNNGTSETGKYVVRVTGAPNAEAPEKPVYVVATLNNKYWVDGPIDVTKNATYEIEAFYEQWNAENRNQPIAYSTSQTPTVSLATPQYENFGMYNLNYFGDGSKIDDLDVTIKPANGATNVTLTAMESPAYTVNVDTKDANRGALAQSSYYLLATYNKDEGSWTSKHYAPLTKVDANSESASIEIRKFTDKDGKSNKIKYESKLASNITVQLVKSANDQLTLDEAADGNGCTIVEAQDNGNDFTIEQSGESATVTIASSHYDVALDVSNANAASLTGSMWALVSATWNGATYYGLARLQQDGSSVQITQLTDVDSGKTIFYSSDLHMDVKLVHAVADDITLAQAVAEDNCIVLDNGYVVNNHLIGIAVAEASTTVSLTKLEDKATDHTASLNFMAIDKTTPLSKLENPALEGTIVAVAKLSPAGTGSKGAAVAYAVQNIDTAAANANGTVSATFGGSGYQALDAHGNQTGETVSFDPSAFDISVTIYALPTEANTYNDIVATGQRTLEGYKFISNKRSDDKKASTITLAQMSENELQVAVTFPRPVTLTEDDGWYALVTLGHESGDDTYSLQKITGSDVSSISVLADTWTNANGEAVSDTFTGHEKSVTVRIVKAGKNITVSEARQKAVAEGNLAGPYVVHYGSENITTSADGKRHLHTYPVSLTDAFEAKEYLDYIDILGNARYFGYVANEWTLNGDAETNGAVKKITNNGQQSGNDKVQYLSGEESRQPWYIGEVTGGNNLYLKVKGDDLDVYTTQDMVDRKMIRFGTAESDPRVTFHVTDRADIDAYIDRMLDHADAMSTAMLSKNSLKVDGSNFVPDSATKLELDFTAYGPGTIYVSLDTVLGGNKTLRDVVATNGGLTIKKNMDQTIVFNTTATEVNLSQFNIKNGSYPQRDSATLANGLSGEYDYAASSIVWNMPNATKVNFVGSSTGIFICPKADVTVSNTSSGWIVADKITNGAGEWHSIWSRYDKNYEKTSAYVTARKKLDGTDPGTKRFTFVLTEEDGTEIERVQNTNNGLVNFTHIFTYESPGTYTYYIAELDEGGKYEYDTARHKVTITVTAKTNGKLVAKTTYDNNSTSIPTFSNTSQQTTYGKLKVQKTVVSAVDADKTQDYEFTVRLKNSTLTGTYGDMTFENGSSTFTLKDGESKTATDLPKDVEYEVTEGEVAGLETTSANATGTISASTPTVTFTNTRNFGSLKVRKSVSQNGGALDENGKKLLAGTYTFGIYTDEACTQPYKVDDVAKTVDVTIGNDGAWATSEEITNLRGGDYWVKELTQTAGIAPVENPVHVEVVPGMVGEASVIAAFTNNLKTGDLEVSKSVASAKEADHALDFNFTVTLTGEGASSVNGTYGQMTFTNGVASFTLKDNTSKSATGLPQGLGYAVTETEENSGGFTTTKQGDTGTINEDKSTASFTNTRTTGDLEVKKTVQNADNSNATFAFTVTLSDTSINGTYGEGNTAMSFTNGVAIFNLGDGQSKKATNLPTSITYTVKETLVNGYATTPEGGEVAGEIVQGTTTKEFVNTRVQKGDLVVKKTVESALDADKNEEFTFTVTLSDTSINGKYGEGDNAMTFENGVATFTLKDNETATATGLPNGTTYTVVETANESFDANVIKYRGTITDHGTAEAAFVNTKRTGQLEVSKQVVSDANADTTNKEFSFTVTTNPKLTGTYGEGNNQVTFDNDGKVTFTLTHDEKKTITGIPYGVEYTVTEDATSAAGFSMQKTGDSGTINKDNAEAKATFTNTRNTGSLEVSKELVSQAAADANQEFEFTVDLGDTTINKTYSEVEFKNGVGTVKITGNGSKLIEGLPQGLNYTVTETTQSQAGYDVTTSGTTGQITDTKAEAKITNTRKTGNLEVHKTVNSTVAGDKTREYHFTVTLGDTGINGKFGEGNDAMTFENGVATFTLKDNETATATGLPIGITYEVAESDANQNNMVTTSTTPNGTIATGTSTATFTNARDNGGLKVVKHVVADRASDKATKFEFTVTLNDNTFAGSYGDMTFTNGVATVELADNEYAEATGLPLGMGYTVTETDNPYFTQTSKTNDEGTIQKTVTVAEFTNTRKTGNFEVYKEVRSDAAADLTKKFTFNVELSDKTISGTYRDMEFSAGKATVTLAHGEKAVAEGLPTGITYTVTEVPDTDFDQETVQQASETIGDTLHPAQFLNTRKTGKLTVSKKLVSDVAADADKDFTFKVTLTGLTDDAKNKTYSEVEFKDGVGTVTLKDGESKTIEGLPTGVRYKVEEVTEGLTNDFTTTPAEATGTITATGTKEEFTNTRMTGSLKVSKQVISDAAADKTTNQTFTFHVQFQGLSDAAKNATYNGTTLTDGEVTFTLSHYEDKVISGLPTGISYTVTEDSTNGFTLTGKTGDTGNISTTKSEATFTNTRQTGDLKLSKVLISDVADDASKEFTFTVTLSDNTIGGTYGGMTFNDGVAIVKLKGGKDATATGLPTGITYTITEATVDGFQNTGKTGEEGTISTTLSEATFTNSKDKGGLIIAKTLVSDRAADADQEFTFNVELSDKSITKSYDGVQFTNGKAENIKIKDGQSKEITDLPIGVDYTVTEATAEGFKLTGKTGDTGTIAKNTTARAEFTNTRETGSLKVSKQVVSDAAADKTTNQTFTFNVEFQGLSNDAKNKVYSGIQLTDGKGTFTLSHGQEKVIKGLPTGISYTVTEAAATGFELTGKTGDTGSISTAQAVAAFTNTREKGNLTVSKAVVSDVAAHKDQSFGFTVTLNDNNINGTYGEGSDAMTFTNGVATFSLKDNESKTATGLPVGVTYTIVEATDGNYTTTRSAGDGAITKDGATVVFTNTRKTGELEVSKNVTSATASDKTKDFAFTVTLDDTAINKTYDDMKFENGVARITLKDGETKKATGLPWGIGYTVTEDEDNAFVITKSGNTGTISGTKSEAMFTNTKIEGGLVVHKSVTSPAAADHTKSFHFTVTLDDESVNGTYGQMTFTNGVANFDLADGNTKSAEGLAKGIRYTVTETTDNDFTTTYTNETGAISNTATSQVEVANTRKTGGFDVSKTVVSDAAVDVSQTFTFDITLSDTSLNGEFGDITFADGTAQVTLVGGDTKHVTGIPTGVTYTVKETANNDFATNQLEQSGIVAQATTGATAYTNTRKTGELEVSKTVVSDAAADADQSFEFTVTLEGLVADKVNGTYGDMTFTNSVATVNLKNGESATATGLPTGISYKVEETANDNFTTNPENRTFTGDISTSKSVAAYTNTRKTGELTVSKEIVSDAAADANQNFEFTVTLNGLVSDPAERTFSGVTFVKQTDGDAFVGTVTLKGGESMTIEGLPTGITYTVAEAANDDFVITTNGKETGSITTTPAEATFTNTRKKGGLMVSKALVSDAAADATRDFTYQVTLSDKTINGTYGDMAFTNGVATGTIRGGENKTATGLPTGVSYTVDEVPANDDDKLTDDFTITYDGETGAIAEGNEPAHATITNTRKTGDLTVSKTLVSDRTADANQLFEFTVTLSDTTISKTYKDMSFDKGVATVTLKGGESATAEGLPTGITYTVTEKEVTGFQNTAKSGDEGTITTTASTAAFTNTRDTGNLTVSKAVVSSVPAVDANQQFTFTIDLHDEGINKTYSEVAFTKGVGTVTLTGGESKTIEGLPTNLAYTVSEPEQIAADFTVESTGGTGTTTTRGTTAAFTNTRRVGKLKITKNVQVNGVPTAGTAADGTYTFRVQGPGIYSDGINKTVTVTNGQSETVELTNLFLGDYTITEVTDDLPQNMRLVSDGAQTVTVTDDVTTEVPTAVFTNNLNTITAHAQATKDFNNWENVQWPEGATQGFAFKLTPEGNAPMPANTLGRPGEMSEEIKVANSGDPVEMSEEILVRFSDITFTREGTFNYKLSEVVPTGADENGVYRGITYDKNEHNVVIKVDADEVDGTLHANVLYDYNQKKLDITNTYAATGQTQIKGTKQLSGRPFRKGDTWTFTLSQPEGQNAPMPKNNVVTVNAAQNAEINFDFETISGFDFDDVGKTYEYIITESGEIENVANDAAKTVTVTVADNGDGTLAVTPSTNETPLTFVNKAQVKKPLIAKKGIEGRDWKTNERGEIAEEFEFELYGEPKDAWSKAKLEASDVRKSATTQGNKHEANFGTFTFTTDDLAGAPKEGRDFTYTVKEVIPEDAKKTQIEDAEGNLQTVRVKNGIVYNEYLYTVTYHVYMENDELKVDTSYARGTESLEALNILNTYTLSEVPATIKAQKQLNGRDITTNDTFEFALYYVNNGKPVGEPEQIKTAERTADGTYVATFDAKTFKNEVNENYVIREVVPQGAKQNDDGTWVKDGVTYDATDHKVRIQTVDEDKNGTLTAYVYYDDSDVAYDANGSDAAKALPTFTNTYFGAEATLDFDKVYVGTNNQPGAFTFTLTATDKDFKDREGAAPVYTKDFVDAGQALKASLTNGDFSGTTARVTSPTITYHEPGTYYYRITEDAKNNVTYDTAQINVTVVVDKDAKATVTYEVVDGDQRIAVGKDDRATLYNNGMIRLRMQSAALRAQAGATSFTNFEPAVRKILKNGVLHSGQFSFALYEGTNTTGTPLSTATNDSNGTVAFDSIQYGPADVGKTYTYSIVEDATGASDAIVTDKGTITLTVTVAEQDGAIVATPSYTKVDADGKAVTTDPDTFIIEYDSIVIRTIKRSREEPHDPLPGAHYGLWMVNPTGEDVYMGLGRDRLEQKDAKLESNENGELYYDFPMVEGVAYYFLEEFPPPAGHLVDPYPTDYFTLVHDKDTDTFRIVYETDPLFAERCPDVQVRE